MSSSKPAIVIVPGAWHRPIHYVLLTQQLQTLGYEAETTDIFTAGHDDQPAEPFRAYVTLIRESILSHTQKGKDAVVVMHSWGGVPGSEAVFGLGKGKEGRAGVVRLVYMTAGIPFEGMSMHDMGPEIFPQLVRVDEENPSFVLPMNPKHILYSDVSEELTEHSLANLAPLPVSALLGTPTRFAWKEVPLAYILCEKDNGIPAAGAELMIDEVRRQGFEVDVRRLEAGHSPFLSMPKETARVIDDIVKCEDV